MFIVNRLLKRVPKINCLLMQSHLINLRGFGNALKHYCCLIKAYFVTKHLRF